MDTTRANEKKSRIKVKSPADRRRYRRLELKLRGRFLFDETEHSLETQEISCGGATIDSPTPPPVGASIVCYFDGLGRVAATIVRQVETGFCVEFTIGPHKRAKLSERLMALLNGALPQDETETTSFEGSKPTPTLITLADGSRLEARVTDISLTGAAFDCSDSIGLQIGETVSVGRLRGEVVRVSPQSFALRFIHMAALEMNAA